MKLVMTLLVRDEIDIVRQNIEFHLERGVDHIIATDNGSMDGTRDVLADFERLGVMTVIDEPARNFQQGAWVTRMALMARDDLAADWILNNDADEFWSLPKGSLKAELAATDAHVLSCQRLNMVYPHDEEGSVPWHRRAIFRVVAPVPMPALEAPDMVALPSPFYYLALPRKVIVRAAGLEFIGEGNHTARHNDRSVIRRSRIKIHHFPVRSAEQFRRKIAQGGAALASNTELSPTVGWHWRRWHRACAEGKFETVLAEALPSAKQLRADLASGRVTRDLRIQASLGADDAPRRALPTGYDLRFYCGQGRRWLEFPFRSAAKLPGGAAARFRLWFRPKRRF